MVEWTGEAETGGKGRKRLKSKIRGGIMKETKKETHDKKLGSENKGKERGKETANENK